MSRKIKLKFKRIISTLLALTLIMTIFSDVKISYAAVKPKTPFKTFELNSDGSVIAEWFQSEQKLEIKGEGKIELDKWEELAKKFHKDNARYYDVATWGKNSDFTMIFTDSRTQFPDVTALKKYYIWGMDYMGFFENFQGEIILPHDMNTSNVTNMIAMFYKTNKANPNVSNWDVSNVYIMKRMFAYAKKANPDVSNWDVSKVENMRGMFERSKQANPDVSKWNVSKVFDMSYMFSYSEKANPDVSNWDVSNVVTMERMFDNTKKANPDTSKWRVPKLKNIKAMFKVAEGVEHINLENTGATYIEAEDAFLLTFKLKSLKIKGLKNVVIDNFAEPYIIYNKDTKIEKEVDNKSSVEKLDDNTHYYLYPKSEKVTTYYLNTPKTVQARWYKNANRLEISGNGKIEFNKWIDLAREFSPFNATGGYGTWAQNSDFTMVFEDINTEFPDITSGNSDGKEVGFFEEFAGDIILQNQMLTNNVTDMSRMFYKTKKANPDISNWNVGFVTNMDSMFAYSEKANPDISKWKPYSLVSAEFMFTNAKEANPDVSKWNVGNLRYMTGMFSYAEKANPDVSKWNLYRAENLNGMFAYTKKANPDVSKWDVRNVAYMQQMFVGAKEANPDVSNWNVANLKDANRMFAETEKAKPNLSKWKAPNLENIEHMFQGAKAVEHIDLENIGTTDVKAQFAFFDMPNLKSLRVKGLTDVQINNFAGPYIMHNKSKNIKTTVNNVSLTQTLDNNDIYHLYLKSDDVEPFYLNEAKSVEAKWYKDINKLEITGEGKIELDKWHKLAQTFHKDNATKSIGTWENNSDFTMIFTNNLVQFPDVTSKEVDGNTKGFFQSFQGEIILPDDMNTSNVTDMERMFAYTKKANPNVSKWDVSNVTNMRYMFCGTNQANPDVSNWDVSNVKYMIMMFGYTDKANPDVSNWDVSNLISTQFMFEGSKQANPDVSNWDVSNLEVAAEMFVRAEKAKPDTSKWRAPKLRYIATMFKGAKAVEHINLENIGAKNVDAEYAFIDIPNLKSLRVKGLKNVKINNFAGPYIIYNKDIDEKEEVNNATDEKSLLDNHNYSLYLQSEGPLQYKITIKQNNKESNDYLFIDEGDKLTKPKDPKNEHQDTQQFAYWFKNEDFENKYDFDKKVISDFDLNALWAKKTKLDNIELTSNPMNYDALIKDGDNYYIILGKTIEFTPKAVAGKKVKQVIPDTVAMEFVKEEDGKYQFKAKYSKDQNNDPDGIGGVIVTYEDAKIQIEVEEDGEITSTIDATPGSKETIKNKKDFDKYGNNFKGWEVTPSTATIEEYGGIYKVVIPSDMPTDEKIKVTAIYDNKTLYKITVQDGKKSPDKAGYAQGETVFISQQIPSGMTRLDHWEAEGITLDSSDKINTSFKIIMPANDVKITGIYTKGYKLSTVEDQVIKTPDKKYYEAGEKVTITQNVAPKKFVKWMTNHDEITDEETIQDTITITMPAKDIYVVPLTANHDSYNLHLTNASSNPDHYTPIKAGQEVSVTADTIAGYTFKQWKVSGIKLKAGEETNPSVKIIMPTNDVSMAATYEKIGTPSTVNVTAIFLENGLELQRQTFVSNTNTSYTADELLAKTTGLEGYVPLFPTTIYDVKETDVTFNITIKPKSTTINHTVTFDTGGGTTIAPQTVLNGNMATEPTPPTKVGYIFDRWELGGVAYDFNTPVTSNITLIAKWIPVVNYTVTFDTDGGSPIAPQSVASGAKATAPTSPTKAGNYFLYWELAGAMYDFNTAVTSDITLIAKWTPILPSTHIVSFDSDGGSSVASQIVNTGSQATKPSDPTKAGNKFNYWDKSGAMYDFTTPVTTDIMLRAIWTPIVNYTVTFDTDGGSLVPSQSVADGDMAIRPADPTKAGYTFDRWELGGAMYDFNTPVTSDITIVAKWNEISSSSSSSSSGGNSGGTTSVDKDDKDDDSRLKSLLGVIKNQEIQDEEVPKSTPFKIQALLKIGSKNYKLIKDGKEEEKQMDVAPFIEKGRTMLPLRYIGQILGLEVKWDRQTRTAILTGEKTQIKIPIDSNKIFVDSKEYQADVKPVIQSGRAFLSISNISKALGLEEGKNILYNAETREVEIRY